jgi:cellulose synthase/poly-beta-1,6-N-acetylglucosamine synthase-like glycosyltransferase
MAVLILKIYLIVVIAILLVYAVRHFTFTINRISGEQRLYYQDIVDSDYPSISVLVPMHNEEKVAEKILQSLVATDYPPDRIEIIPINDHSEDSTREIIDRYAARYPILRPLHRLDDDDTRGKQAALNEAIPLCQGDVIIVFDADYMPQKGALRDLAISFTDPEVGAVMGRVVPINTGVNLLTRLLDLERSGGYQVDQQARHNLRLLPQYGGTVGGFRKEVVESMGGFDTRVLAEDTDLTFMLATRGWKVVYANRVECYEESPENWIARGTQIFRWSRGHNHVLFKHFFSVLRTPYLPFREKFDAMLLLCLYLIPFFILTGMIDSMILFFLGEMQIIDSIFVFFFVAGYNTFGNFAPFYQIGTATLLDGVTRRIRLLPFLLFYFILNVWTINLGLFAAIGDTITRREVLWQKTERYRGPDKNLRRNGDDEASENSHSQPDSERS